MCGREPDEAWNISASEATAGRSIDAIARASRGMSAGAAACVSHAYPAEESGNTAAPPGPARTRSSDSVPAVRPYARKKLPAKPDAFCLSLPEPRHGGPQRLATNPLE